MMESGQHSLPDDPHNRRDGKILLTVGRHAGWPKHLAGFQGPFISILSYPQEGNSGVPWVWAGSK